MVYKSKIRQFEVGQMGHYKKECFVFHFQIKMRQMRHKKGIYERLIFVSKNQIELVIIKDFNVLAIKYGTVGCLILF